MVDGIPRRARRDVAGRGGERNGVHGGVLDLTRVFGFFARASALPGGHRAGRSCVLPRRRGTAGEVSSSVEPGPVGEEVGQSTSERREEAVAEIAVSARPLQARIFVAVPSMIRTMRRDAPTPPSSLGGAVPPVRRGLHGGELSTQAPSVATQSGHSLVGS